MVMTGSRGMINKLRLSMTLCMMLAFLALGAVTAETHGSSDYVLNGSPTELADGAGRPELVLRHTEDSRSRLEVTFVLYSSGTVVLDERHSGNAADYRVVRVTLDQLRELRKFILPPKQFFELPARIQAGHVRDGPSFEVIASTNGAYKSVAVTGLVERTPSADPIFAPEIERARAE